MAKTIFATPPESFRVRPVKGSRYYFIVHLAADRRALKAAMRKHSGWAHPQQVAACISAYGRQKSNRGLVGILFFARTHIGGGLVAHEMAHAAFRYCERRNLKVRHWLRRPHNGWGNTSMACGHEERFCDYIEELTRQFWCHFYGSTPH